MDARSLLETVSADNETALSRLASSKVLYALSGGVMDDDAVIAAMRTRTSTAADRFDDWAATESDEVDAETFAAAARSLRDDVGVIDAVAQATGVDPSPADLPDPGPLFDHLADLKGALERTAGLTAWTLVEDGVRSQAVAFFVGRADPSSAERFRELRSTVEAIQADAIDRLDVSCQTDADWTDAVAVADETVDVTYGHYVELLEEMGIKVKPVC